MLDRLMGAVIAATVVLASSSVALPQNTKQGAQQAKTPAASNKPFDKHDLSGFWDITNIGRPPGALNETSNNRPPMTPWGLEKFRKAKTGYDGKALGNGVYPNEKDWNDPILLCDPTGFPRIMWHPTPPGMRLLQTGDEVLRRVARTFAGAVRELDLPGRYGGEEIAVVLPGTNLTGARALSEKIRKGLEELAHTTPDGIPFQVTASFGAACFPAQSNAGDLVAAADAALYEAKRTGKNRVVTATAKRKARGQATAADAPAPA